MKLCSGIDFCWYFGLYVLYLFFRCCYKRNPKKSHSYHEIVEIPCCLAMTKQPKIHGELEAAVVFSALNWRYVELETTIFLFCFDGHLSGFCWVSGWTLGGSRSYIIDGPQGRAKYDLKKVFLCCATTFNTSQLDRGP